MSSTSNPSANRAHARAARAFAANPFAEVVPAIATPAAAPEFPHVDGARFFVSTCGRRSNGVIARHCGVEPNSRR